MTAKLQALQSLLVDIADLGAVAEDQGINKIPSFDPLLEKARSLGIDITAPTTLDDLRTAVENACEAVKAEPEAKNPAAAAGAKPIFGNKNGIPGDGP
jgi:hypothetical protein